MKSTNLVQLKNILEKTLEDFVLIQKQKSDAIEPALIYSNAVDREFAGFICSTLAYGRVEHIKKSAHRILDPMGATPTQWLISKSNNEIKKIVKGWKHRFNTEEDMFRLLLILKYIYTEFESIENFLKPKNNETASQLLERFVYSIENLAKLKLKIKFKTQDSFWFFLPKPSSGGACKRLNLFLRWMVGRGPMDFNIWTTYSTKNLVIPLDVHLLNQARSLKLTKRKTADWKAVEEVTAKLRLLDPQDPTRFDFALCHLGMQGKILTLKELS